AHLRRRGGAAHQRKIFSVTAAHAEARSRACDNRPRGRRWLQISVENISEKRGLLLLLLATAEKEIEQAFGRTHLGRQRHVANDGGSNKHAEQLALKGQLGTQRLLHSTAPMQHDGRAARFSFAILVDGERSLSGAEKGKKRGRWARQAPHSRHSAGRRL